MKKLLFIPGLLISGFFLFQAFTGPDQNEARGSLDAKEILTASCFDCHSNMGKNDKPKDALNFDLWDTYDTGKKISKLADICKMLDEGKMPPEKYLKFNPHKALSDEAKHAVCTWADEETEKLMAGE